MILYCSFNVLLTIKSVSLSLYSFRWSPGHVPQKSLPRGVAKMAAEWQDLPRRTLVRHKRIFKDTLHLQWRHHGVLAGDQIFPSCEYLHCLLLTSVESHKTSDACPVSVPSSYRHASKGISVLYQSSVLCLSGVWNWESKQGSDSPLTLSFLQQLQPYFHQCWCKPLSTTPWMPFRRGSLKMCYTHM